MEFKYPIQLDRLVKTSPEALKYIKEKLFCKSCNELTFLIKNNQTSIICRKCDNRNVSLTEDDKKHLSSLKLRCSQLNCEEVFSYENIRELDNHENECNKRGDSKFYNDESSIYRSKIDNSVNLSTINFEARLKKIENFLGNHLDSNFDLAINSLLARKGLIPEDHEKSKYVKKINKLIKNFEIKNPLDYESHIKLDTNLEKLEILKNELEKYKNIKINDSRDFSILKVDLDKIEKDISDLNNLLSPIKNLNTKISQTIKDLELTSLCTNKDQIFIATKNKFIKVFENSRGYLIEEIKTSTNLVTSMITIENELLIYGDGGKVMIHNLNNSQSREVISLSDGLLVSSLIEYDNKTVIVGSSGYLYYQLDLDKKEIIKEFDTVDSYNILKLLTLKPLDILIIGSAQGTLKVYENKKFNQNLDGHSEAIQSIIKLKSDGNKLVTSDRLGTIIMWDIKNNFKEILRKERKDYLKTDKLIFNCEVCELHTKNMLIVMTKLTTITFFDLNENFKILRQIELSPGGKFLLNLDDGIIFSINSAINIWK